MSASVNGSVLAMYDIRGKQEFIFRTNKLKEIAGGSWIIRDCFNDYLFDEAKKIDHSNDHSKGIFNYKDNNGKTIEGSDFTEEKYLQHLEEGYIGEVVYDGGGNFILLLESEKTFRELTYRFTKRLMEEIGTLRVLGSCVPIENLNDYQGDNEKLRKAHRRHEMEESIIAPWSCLPIVQVDRQTSQPLVPPNMQDKRYNLLKNNEKSKKHSKETWAKLMKYREEMDRIEKGQDSGNGVGQGGQAVYHFSLNEGIFDRLAPKKGEDSQLAVIYIDGNGMGAKVQNCLADNRDYKSCVTALRNFSADIQEKYVDRGIDAVMLNQKEEQEHRIVVYAGDEVNFVVPARDAYGCVKRYLGTMKGEDSACAGIAVFHSHSPYSEAYRVAEECCKSGKKWMKENEVSNACLLDFHIIQGAVGVSLEEIRRQENGGVISRPWLYKGISEEKGITKIKDVERVATMFRKLGRGNIKNLADLAKKGATELNLDLMRIRAHQSETARKEMEADWEWLNGMDDVRKRSLIYDVVQAYDLWFKERETGANINAEGNTK